MHYMPVFTGIKNCQKSPLKGVECKLKRTATNQEFNFILMRFSIGKGALVCASVTEMSHL